MEEALDQLPNLVKLNVNGCIALARLVLRSCTKLQWLDCSGCSRLHHITSFSPALTHVDAVACANLAVRTATSVLLTCCG